MRVYFLKAAFLTPSPKQRDVVCQPVNLWSGVFVSHAILKSFSLLLLLACSFRLWWSLKQQYLTERRTLNVINHTVGVSFERLNASLVFASIIKLVNNGPTWSKHEHFLIFI